jgi:hypothetical protein
MAAQIVTARELTPAEYGARHGLSEGQVRRRCEEGLITGAYKLGLRWKIPDIENDMVTREEYDALNIEITELRATIKAMLSIGEKAVSA